MVFVESNINLYYRQKIQDWLTQSWIHKEQDSAYRSALAAVLQTLWNSASRAALATSSSGGKEEQSFLPLPSLCSYALGEVTETVTAVNAAWVLLYTASFLLDKIEDEELEHPIFSHFSPGVVANLSTGLILHSERILAELEPDKNTSTAAIDAVRRRYNPAALEVCAGQHLDLTVREPGFHQIWEIVDAKSGKFFALGAFLGARLVTDDSEKIDLLTQVGRRLGILIQIRNDLQGFGNPLETGCDLACGKRTLPVQYALQVLPAEERARLSTLLTAAMVDSSAEIEARKMIISAGAIVYLSLEAEKHRQQAVKALNQLGMDQLLIRPLLDLLDFANPAKKATHNRHP